MPTDCELLHQYASKGDEAAFAELVRRHADLVYSVALRVTSNSALAQDVTQTVFTQLAQQACGLGRYHTLIGWLHTAARRRAIDVVRSEQRRRVREQEATAMQNISSAPETNWAEIGPLLDEAVGQLKETDRDVVLLRFFKNLSHQEVGASLGLGEDAARKRIDRALEKLREHFARRGVAGSSALLATAIVENSVQAAPVGLVANVTAASLAGIGGVATGSTFLITLFTFLMSTKTKTILTAAVILALIVTLAFKLQNFSELSAAPSDSSTTPVKPLSPVAASLPKASSAPVAMPMAAAVAKPVVAPVPASGSSKGGAPDVVSGGTLIMADPFAAAPNADLKTAIPALIHYLETDGGDAFSKSLTKNGLACPPKYAKLQA